jgi:hypothetical protein
MRALNFSASTFSCVSIVCASLHALQGFEVVGVGAGAFEVGDESESIAFGF